MVLRGTVTNGMEAVSRNSLAMTCLFIQSPNPIYRVRHQKTSKPTPPSTVALVIEFCDQNMNT